MHKNARTVKIIVEGTGLIPRMNQIAPIYSPLDVTLDELNLILRTPTLTVKLVSPIDGHTVTMNRKNYHGMLKLYTAWVEEKAHLDAVAIDEKEKMEADAIPMSDEDKRDLEYAKKKGYVPANSGTLTKTEVQEAVDSAFAALVNEPKKIEPVQSQIKTVNEILKDKKK